MLRPLMQRATGETSLVNTQQVGPGSKPENLIAFSISEVGRRHSHLESIM